LKVELKVARTLPAGTEIKEPFSGHASLGTEIRGLDHSQRLSMLLLSLHPIIIITTGRSSHYHQSVGKGGVELLLPL